MKTRPWYRVWPEWLALCFGRWTVPFLPRGIIVALASLLGHAGYLFSPKLRGIALANLRLVFGDSRSDRENAALLKRCYRHFALLILDVLWFSRHPEKRLKTWVQWDDSTAALFEPGAKLLLTAHYGNWETVGQAFAAKGQPLMSVATPLKNPRVDQSFIQLRQATGQIIIPREGAARKLLQGLRNGNKLAVLLDQNTLPREGGIFVPFFDRPVPVSAAPAALAVKTNTPVHTATCVPDMKGRYTVTVHGTLLPDPSAPDPVAHLTGRMTRNMEHVIREAPEYWCWMYKRWKYIPDGANASAYPDYAKPLPDKYAKPAAQATPPPP